MPIGYTTLRTGGRNAYAGLFYSAFITKDVERIFKALLTGIEESYKEIKAVPGVENAALSPLRQFLDGFKYDVIRPYKTVLEKRLVKWYRRMKRGFLAHWRHATAKLYKVDISALYDGKAYDDLFKLAIEGNVALITGLLEQEAAAVQSMVYQASAGSLPMAGLKKQLEAKLGITKRRAALIARDQTSKATSALNELQQQEAGIEYFEWDTAHDGRVSTGEGGHKQLQGKIYKYGDVQNYPVIDSSGNRGLPGDRVNCRCTALAVFLKPGFMMKQLKDGSYAPARE